LQVLHPKIGPNSPFEWESHLPQGVRFGIATIVAVMALAPGHPGRGARPVKRIFTLSIFDHEER